MGDTQEISASNSLNPASVSRITQMTPNSSSAVLSLFSGAGGFSYGFKLAGLDILGGAELDQDACESYGHNVDSPCHNVDLSSTDPDFFFDLAGGRSPFAIIGGPPCQGFSTAGPRRADDPRNQLIFNYFRIVEKLKPRWFLFENVEGLLTSGMGEAVVSLVSEFVKIGYSVRVQKVNFAGYGVPQTRKRVLIIGNRLGLNFEFPAETHSFASGKSQKRNGKPFAPTFDEATSTLGNTAVARNLPAEYKSPPEAGSYDELMRGSSSSRTVSLHFDNTSADDAHRYSLLRPGQTMKDLPEEMWHESYRKRAFRRVMDGTPTEKRGGAPSGIKRLHGNLHSLTITGAASREFIHPHQNRPLTLRECARLQSFPDHFHFAGNSASVAQQIGNAVPPLAAKILAMHVMHLDGEMGERDSVKHSFCGPGLLGFVLTEATAMSPALGKTHQKLTGLIQSEFSF